MLHSWKTAVAAVLFAVALLVPRPVAAQYPERTITIVCASGAGGIVDVTTRIVTDHMARTLGRSIVVQNEAGAGGTLAIHALTKAAPDGYTLLTIGPTVSVASELFPKSGVDVLRDLEPVSIIGVAPLVLLVHNSVPATDYPSFIAYLKSHPNELTTASNGRGSAGHLAGSLFKKMAGVEIRYIPYRTTPQAQADLIGGRLSMMWLSTLTDHVQKGTLRALAVSTLERWKMFPEIPTVDELGLKGYEATTWVSLYVPKGTPKEVIARLHQAVDAALTDPAVLKRFDDVGQIPPRVTGPDFNGKYLKAEIDKWAEILRNSTDE